MVLLGVKHIKFQLILESVKENKKKNGIFTQN